METSEYIAALLGPVLIVSALSILLNRAFFDKLIVEFTKNPAIIFIAGIGALVIGLAIVNAHNIWVWGWPVIITIFGWMAIVGGIMRMMAPQFVIEIAITISEHKQALTFNAVALLALGGLLTAFGYRLIT